MKRITGLCVMACFCLLFLVTLSPTRAQTPFTTTIVISDSLDSDTLHLGVNASATFGIDSLTLGEKELPPSPPIGVFDTRFVDPRQNGTMGQGMKLDLRPLVYDIQSDTFAIVIQWDSLARANGAPMKISWSSGIGSLGGGRWRIVDPTTGGSLLNKEMVGDSSYNITVTYNQTYGVGAPSNLPRWIWIIKADNVKFRTFSYDSLAVSGGKGNAAKATKAITVDFAASFAQVVTAHADSMVVAFAAKVFDTTLVYSPFTTIKALKTPNDHKTFGLYGAVVDSLGVVQISGVGQTGAKMKAKVTWWYHHLQKPKKAATATDIATMFTKNNLELPMPDLSNAGLKLVFPALNAKKIGGIVVGDSSFHGDRSHAKWKDSTYYVYHTKWADVLKSLVKWTGTTALPISTLHSHPSHTLYHDLLFGTKIMAAKVEGLPPDKESDRLFAELLTLKVNIMFSEQNISGGHDLKNLIVIDPANLFYNMHVSDIAATSDTFLTRGYVMNPAMSAMTKPDLMTAIEAMLNSINGAFNGPIDTTSWSTGVVYFKPVRYVSDLTWLARDPLNPASTLPMRPVASTEPKGYVLHQNYPNPFNPTTTIRFTLPEASFVTVKVYNLLGQEVATLANHVQFSDGTNEVKFDAQQHASGVYFYRLIANDISSGAVQFQQVRKMMLLK